MKKLTIDQAEIIFSLFVAQNGNRKISEFVERYNNDTKISELCIERKHDELSCLRHENWNYFSCDLRESDFFVWVSPTKTFFGARGLVLIL
jgi:hypothetical protein